MRMMRYDFYIVYTPGKNLLVADALSRCPVPHHEDDNKLSKEVDVYIHVISLSEINTSDKNIVKVLTAQAQDPVCIQLKELLSKEWPSKADLPLELREYYSVRDELCVIEGILTR